MTLISSLLFGSTGSYRFAGLEVKFLNQSNQDEIFGSGSFSKLTNHLLENELFKFVTLGYLHVFIHEMGHALAGKLCGGNPSRIDIQTKNCGGNTYSTKSNIFIKLAGPAMGTAWEIAKLASGIAMIILFGSYGLPIGIFLCIGSIAWITGEAAYAFSRNADWSFLRGG